MDISGVFAHEFFYGGEESDDVVFDFFFDFIDAFHVKIGFFFNVFKKLNDYQVDCKGCLRVFALKIVSYKKKG